MPRFNPDMLLRSEGARTLLEGLQERLEVAKNYLAPVSLVALHIEDHAVEGLTEEDRARLRARATTLVQRSIRREKHERRRVTDALFMVDDLFFIVLYNADRRNYLVPLGRMVDSLRHEAFVALGMAGEMSYKRTIVIGSATWLPKHGDPSSEALFGRSIEALMMAFAAPQPDTCERLRVAPSSHDNIRLYEYGWDEGFALSDAKVFDQPLATQSPSAITAALPQSPPVQAPVKTEANIRIQEEKRRPWWQFWKR